jgi:hypothetical protein
MNAQLRALLSLAGLLVALCIVAQPAAGAGAKSVWWNVTLGARPSVLRREAPGELVVDVENLGYKPANSGGGTATITDTVPGGFEVVDAEAVIPVANVRSVVPCVVTGQTVTCELEQELQPYAQVELRVDGNVKADAVAGETTEVTVAGGEANSVRASSAVAVDDEATPFGLQSYSLLNEEAGGDEDLRAGSHPFQQTTELELNQTADTSKFPIAPDSEPAGTPKDLNFLWPAGLIGNPTAVPECTASEFANEALGGSGNENECPADTAVGVATVTANEPALLKSTVFTVPVFNLEPELGEPARFGFYIVEAGTPVYIDASVRTGSDYGVTIASKNITQTAGLLSAKVTVWGAPAAPVHDGQRGWGCLLKSLNLPTIKPCNTSETTAPKPFLSLPSKCAVPLESSVTGDSWQEPTLVKALAAYRSSGLSGCSDLGFGPDLGLQGSSGAASSPTGLRVVVHVPQGASENASGVNSSTIRTVNVRFPEGVSVNPAAANGMTECTEAQIGYLSSLSAPPADLRLTPEPASCPSAARLGTVKITTPLLKRPLEGYLYLASPENFSLAPPGENPFKSLIATYLVAEDPASGVLVKLAGAVGINETTGQVETSFEDVPDVSTEDVEVTLFAGGRAAFSTPDRCGRYTALATFTPWSGQPATSSAADLDITSGAGGGACAAATLPFATELHGGSRDPRAGAFTPFTTQLTRSDGQQALGRLSVTLPSGVAGVLKGVPLCADAQAATGSCGTGSLLGTAAVTAGTGSEPYVVNDGRVYLTEGFEGAPYGLAIVTPAIAGPFNLGQVVVRARIDVNPVTGQVTVTTSPLGSPFAIPRMLRGIPLQIKSITATIDRPNFTFNPTNCGALQMSAVTTGFEGGTSADSSPFAVTNCAALKFQPALTATATSKISRLNGIAFNANVAFPKGAALGTESNVKKVKVTLPVSLPSRVETLHKSCLAQIFEHNPAECRPESIVGHATVHTQLLGVPLTGPVYFVSHGGEAFPSLTMVLQGDGITIELVGATLIRKGITSTTFTSVPDLPFESFALALPAGKYSALSGYGNLCKVKPRIGVEFIAQDGQKTSKTSAIKLAGCKKPAQKKKRKTRARRK